MNNILRFKQCLDTDKKNRELSERMDIIQVSLNSMSFFSFHLVARKHCGLLSGSPEYFLVELDEEDIQYFKDKYLPKLHEEMNAEINKIKQQYEAE